MGAEDREAGAAGRDVFGGSLRGVGVRRARLRRCRGTRLRGMDPVELGKVLSAGCQPIRVEPDDHVSAAAA